MLDGSSCLWIQLVHVMDPLLNDILVELPTKKLHHNLHPISHLQACPLNIPQTSKLFGVIWPFNKGDLEFPTHHEQKTIMGPPTNILSLC